VRDAFYTVKLLEDANWGGMRHFDAHPYRTDTAEGVWEFAAGCMRSYLILRDKARRFTRRRHQGRAAALREPTLPAGPTAGAAALRTEARPQLPAARGCGHERLDQLVNDCFGVR
jgi:xylose isomerase